MCSSDLSAAVLAPSQAELRMRLTLAVALAVLGSPPAAEAEADRAAELAPLSARAFLIRARVRLFAGRTAAARLDAGGLAIAAALVLGSPYTPMLFMGEEWGARTPWLFFTDHDEPELAEAVRRGRTAEFAGHGWEELYGGPVEVPDPQAVSTVAASRVDRKSTRLNSSH